MEAYAVYLHLDLLEVVPGRGDQRRLIIHTLDAKLVKRDLTMAGNII
jgi:hypothetical protein